MRCSHHFVVSCFLFFRSSLLFRHKIHRGCHPSIQHCWIHCSYHRAHSSNSTAPVLNIHHFIFILFVLINFKLADVERRSSGNHSEQTPNNFESGGKQFQSHQLLNVVRPRRHCRYRFLVASMMWLCAFFMHIRSWCLSSFLLLWHNRKVISEGNARHLILRRTFHPKSEVFQHENCCYTPPIPMLTENYCDEWDEPRFIHCHVIQFQ